MQNNFDGFIVDGVKASLLNPNLALYRKCYEELEIPIVFYNNYYKELAYPHVVTDDRKSSHLLTSHLISQGHRNIAGIFVCDNYQALEKFHGMYETMLEHHIDLDDDYIKWCVSDEAHNERFQKEIERFLDQHLQRLFEQRLAGGVYPFSDHLYAVNYNCFSVRTHCADFWHRLF